LGCSRAGKETNGEGIGTEAVLSSGSHTQKLGGERN
jgi:hypothetical protein